MAYRYYKHAASLLEKIRANLSLDPYKVGFLEIKADVFESMVPLAIRLGDEKGRRVYYREAFRWVEASKARSLIDMLAPGTPRPAVPAISEAPDARLRSATERDLRRLVAAVRAHEAERYDTHIGGDLLVKTEKMSYRQVLDKMARAEENVKKRYPELVSQYAVQVPNLKKIAAHLDEDTLALEYFLGQNDLTIFPLSPRGLGRIVRVVNIHQDLEKFISVLPEYLEGTEEKIRFLQDSTDHLHTILIRLYEMLIEPLYNAGVLSDSANKPERLVIFPHGILSYVPFHLLMRQDTSFLLDHFEISYAPSATAYMLCSAKGKRRKRKCVIFGTPASRLDSKSQLKEIEKEMLDITQVFGSRRDVFYRKRCNTDNFRKFAGSGDILHFCGHGKLIQDSLDMSGLQLWNRLFTVRETFGLDLSGTATVVLNACVMMKDMVAKGNEVQGMVKALFAAGAAALIIALWEVPDRAGALFAKSFYENYVFHNLSRAASIRKAMQDVRDYGDPNAGVFKHPYFWGPYFLMGDWR